MKVAFALTLTIMFFNSACEKSPSINSNLKTEEHLAEGRYRIKASHSGLCLESPSGETKPGTLIQQWTCNNSEAQTFQLKKSGRGYRLSKAGVSIDVKDRSKKPGTSLQLWASNADEAQIFLFERSKHPNEFWIRSVLSGFVLDVDAMSKAPGSKVIQWHKTGNANQRFLLEKIPENDAWKLVWSDEFNAPDIDRSKWNFEVKKPRWVNNELQNYTDNRPENARIENGNLVIEARRDHYQNHEYSSARLKTEGKASWKYGRIEARIKLPKGLGTWPAFWMMPDDQKRGWPACGEIDIMEHVGFENDVIHATTHSATYSWKSNTQRTAKTHVAGATDDFHVYSMEWRADRIDMFVDGRLFNTSSNDGTGEDAYPFDKNFHIILNLAVGGDWGGQKGIDPNAFPQKMLVDYVRVYQR